MRLLVVSAAPPDKSFSRVPARITAPQPPGPGLPLHAPSVAISTRSEEHTSELQSLMRISYAVFCLKKNNNQQRHTHTHNSHDLLPHIICYYHIRQKHHHHPL